MTTLLDASAVLAWLQQEPGGGAVGDVLEDALVTAANWSEVLQKTEQHGSSAREVTILLQALGLKVIDVTRADGEEAARLWQRGQDLSLADRLCLAAAKRLRRSAVTTESRWRIFAEEVDIQVIR